MFSATPIQQSQTQKTHEIQEIQEGPFVHALNRLVQRLGAPQACKPTPISIFKARYNTFLKQANEGRVEIISQGAKRYVLLTEQQLIVLMDVGPDSPARTLADSLASLTPPRERLDRGGPAASFVMLAGPGHDPVSLPDRPPKTPEIPKK